MESRQRLRRPPADKIWLHIDRFGKRNGRVWAVQFTDSGGKPRYATAKAVICDAPCYSQVFTIGQPRAVIEFSGAVVRRLGSVVRISPKERS